MRPVTWVTIEEVASGLWGIAGKPRTRATSSHALRCPVVELTTGVPAADAVQIADEVAMPTPPRGCKAQSGVAPVARLPHFRGRQAAARALVDRSLT
jgi:hypothetical protein